MRYVENGLPPTRPLILMNDAGFAVRLLAATDAVLPQAVTKQMPHRFTNDQVVVIRDAISVAR